MDLNTIETIERPTTRDSLPAFRPGDAWLAGGSWLFSEPQPRLRRLLDLRSLGWAPLTLTGDGLEIAATCTIATLEAWNDAPPSWTAAAIIGACCEALLGSFKVWNVATVGGNMCLALPAGPMTALAVALDGQCLVWGPDGRDRTVAAADFVLGDRRNALTPGEVLRAIHLPATALGRRAALRQISLSPLGRSGALLIGTRDSDGLIVTVTASTRRPFQVRLPATATDDTVADGIDSAIGPGDWHDDVHGRPDWRQHVTHILAREIVAELRREPDR